MSSEVAISVHNVSKYYAIYDRPHDRLAQMLLPRLRRLLGLTPSKHYREFWSLRDISFDIKRGETIGIIGRNGSGKSTLLQLICGTLKPSSGEIRTRGRIAALLELGAGFNPEFTGRENAILNATILGLSPAEIERRIIDIEAFADVGDFFDRPVKTYSSGMYVRVAFAVQACIEPEILIVDEALAVGDAPFQAKCMDYIHRLRSQGTSVLFVSHDVSSVRTLCDRAIWLDKGVMRLAGAVMPVTSAYIENVFKDGQDTSKPLPEPTDGTCAESIQPVQEHAPINHWGSRVGILRAVKLCNEEGRETSTIHDREIVKVMVTLDIPADVDRSTLSVAFSFKSLAGVDLVVGTTWHDGRLSFSDSEDSTTVCFSSRNVLNSGEYMLAIGVEERTEFSINYFEYIEGAKFFRVSHSNEKLGVAVPEITKYICSSELATS